MSDAIKIYRKQIASNLRTCRGCPSMQRVPLLGMTCGNFLNIPSKIPDTCGCALTAKAMLHFVTECPQGKWKNERAGD